MSTVQAPIWELPDAEPRVEGLDEHGQPDPAYAEALGLVPAPLSRRAGAALFDVVLFALMQVPFVVLALPLVRLRVTGRISWYGLIDHPDFLRVVIGTAVTVGLTLVLVVAQLGAQGRAGFTAGQLVAGLRVINVKTLGRPGVRRVTLRALVVWGSIITVVGPILFLASPWLNRRRRRRGWHDRVGRTWVIDVRHGLDPFDEKLMRIARKTVTSTPTMHVKQLPSLATSADGDPQRHESFRPGERSSAGVLGVARPHSSKQRLVVGLAGLEPTDPPPVPVEDDVAGPVLGGYRPAIDDGPRSRPDDAAPEATDEPASSPGPSPTPAPAPSIGSRARVEPGQPAVLPAFSPRPVETGGGVAPAPWHPSAPPTPAFALMLDSGVRIGLTQPVMIGRAPEPTPEAHPMAIEDPTRSISKTHVLLRPAASGVEVVDQGSTNGTEIMCRGELRRLVPAEVGLAAPGDTIRFGDRSALVMES